MFLAFRMRGILASAWDLVASMRSGCFMVQVFRRLELFDCCYTVSKRL